MDARGGKTTPTTETTERNDDHGKKIKSGVHKYESKRLRFATTQWLASLADLPRE